MRTAGNVGIGGLAAVAVTYGFGRYGYGLFLPAFRQEFALSTEALGVLASASYGAYLVTLLVTGVLAARVGPRPPVVIGALSAAAGMSMVSVARSTTVLAVGVVLAGSSAGWSWAPFSDAVARLVRAGAQGRTLSMISTGTTFGLTAAAPVAVIAGATWRPVWLIFAGFALAAAAYNAWILPAGAVVDSVRLPRIRPGWFVCPRSGPLMAYGFVYTLAGAVYLTYVVDLVRASGLTAAAGPLLWLLIGIAGVVALATGDLVTRYGLRGVLIMTVAGLAAATAFVGVAPSSWVALSVSATLFGASYMTAAAFHAVWSSRVFWERPSTGFTAAILVASVGSIVGPAAAGLMAGRAGLAPTFVVLALLTMVAGLLKPAAADATIEPQQPVTLAER